MPYSFVTPSAGITACFVLVMLLVLSSFLAAVFVTERNARGDHRAAVRGTLLAAVGVALWIALTGAYVAFGGTRAGVPGLVGFFALGNLGAIGFAFSRYGRRLGEHLPLAALAGFHVFRLPLELVLHALASEGTIPVQMTFEGHNFDIVTGLFSAVVIVYALVTRRDIPRGLAIAFNTVGLALLLVVIGIVLLSSPLPIKRYEGPPLLLGLHLPYAWIAPIGVAGALAAHLISFRAIFRGRPDRSTNILAPRDALS